MMKTQQTKDKCTTKSGFICLERQTLIWLLTTCQVWFKEKKKKKILLGVPFQVCISEEKGGRAQEREPATLRAWLLLPPAASPEQSTELSLELSSSPRALRGASLCLPDGAHM